MRLTSKRISWLTAFALVAAIFTGASARADDKSTPLGDEMDAMNKAYKALKKQVADAAQTATSLDLIAEMERHAIAAKGMVPAFAAKQPEADRPKFIAAYKAAINDLLIEYMKIENELLNGKNETAAKMLDDVNKIKKDGHSKFQEPE